MTGNRLIAFSRRLAAPIAGEATLIIVSILLAFAIDAAWDGREERMRERELLVALRADFVTNQELLETARWNHQSNRQAALDFLDLSTPGSDAENAPIPDAALLGLVSWHTYDPVLGSLNSAIYSGQLSLIRDDDLRVALAGWVDSVEDLNELEVVDRGHAHRFSQIAFEFVPFRSVVVRMGAAGRSERQSTAQADYRSLFTSLRAENVAINRVAEIGFILDDLARVEEELERILKLLPVSDDR